MSYKISPEFTLNDAGKCIADTDVELLECIKHAMALSPTNTVIVVKTQEDRSLDSGARI